MPRLCSSPTHRGSACTARFDETRHPLALSFAAALFVIGFVAPGLSELLALRPEGSSMIGAIRAFVVTQFGS
jgi:hypothetical protein